MSGYNQVIEVRGWRFRYNYGQCLLEVVDKEDEVIDVQGLGLENWKENPEMWCEQYADELDEMIAHEMAEFVL